MRRLALVTALSLPLSLAACGGDPKPAAPAFSGVIDQSSPKSVAEGIFAAARAEKYDGLAAIVDPVDADGDSKKVGAVGKADAAGKAGFRDYFSKGTVSGDVKVEGDRAEVPILFGPEGKKPETFVMNRRDGKWYLSSF